MASESRPTILIVEDERTLAELYRTWLADEYAVRVALSGEAALEELDTDVDIVLLDRRIPEPPGDDVLAVLRDRGLNCRVAMVTAVAPSFDILELGIDDYLVKPVAERELVGVVERLHRRSSYTVDVQRYFSLAAKKAALDAELSTYERFRDERYRELESSIASLYGELQVTLATLDSHDYEALFRDFAESSVPAD